MEQDNDTRRDRSVLATHVPLLVRVFDISKGDVLEIGTGYFSTLVLHWLAHITKRKVYSYENRDYWYQRALKLKSPYHEIVKVSSWDELPVNRHWGLVFIDHSPEARRHIEVERFAKSADYIVMHDTQPEDDAMYQFGKIWHLFKYRYDWKNAKPWASVVSNFKALADL
jgi:hypothetical protein